MKTENYFQYCFVIDPANIMGDFNKYMQPSIDQMRCPRTGPFQHDSNLEVDVLIDPDRCKGPTVQQEKIVKTLPHILSFTCLQPKKLVLDLKEIITFANKKAVLRGAIALGGNHFVSWVKLNNTWINFDGMKRNGGGLVLDIENKEDKQEITYKFKLKPLAWVYYEIIDKTEQDGKNSDEEWIDYNSTITYDSLVQSPTFTPKSKKYKKEKNKQKVSSIDQELYKSMEEKKEELRKNFFKSKEKKNEGKRVSSNNKKRGSTPLAKRKKKETLKASLMLQQQTIKKQNIVIYVREKLEKAKVTFSM